MSMAKPGTPIQLVPEALGTYEWQISTDSPEAQRFSIRACSYSGRITCLNLWPHGQGTRTRPHLRDVFLGRSVLTGLVFEWRHER